MEALRLVEAWPVPTAAAAVVGPDGSVVASVGDQHHRFRLASVTKIVTSLTIQVAVEEGTVGWNDPAGPSGATLRHLLAHAAGYPFEGTEPIAPLGERRIYSNTGINVAADHLAAAAEMPFGDYLREGVLAPLGIARAELRSTPAEGLYCTAAELAAVVGELIRPQLVAPETAAEAATIQFPDLAGIVPGVGRFDPCPWGLGLEIKGAKHPHWTGETNAPTTFGHFGGSGTMAWVDPTRSIGVLALTDRPFDDWALSAWPELSDAVLAEAGGSRTQVPA